MEIIIIVGCAAIAFTALFTYITSDFSQFTMLQKIAIVTVSNPISKLVWENRKHDCANLYDNSHGFSLETYYARIVWIKLLEKHSNEINSMLENGDIVYKSNNFVSKQNDALANEFLDYLCSRFSKTHPMKSPKLYSIKINELLKLNKKNH